MPIPQSGVVPPVVTPLTEDRKLDQESFRRVLERLLDSGVDGIFVLGSTGEVAFSSDALRDQVVSQAAEVVAGRVPLLVGVVDMQTARVIDHAKRAESLGADALVATAPFYAATPTRQVSRHFMALREAVTTPVFAYDLPVAVHSKLDPDELVALGRANVIAGVKDSSGDDVGFRRLVQRNRDAGEPLRLFTGHEVMVDGAYLSGAHGVVPGLGNVDPDGYVQLARACAKGEWEEARRIQDRLTRLMEICWVARDTGGWGKGVGAFKTALMLQGVIECNQLPEPFTGFSARDVAAVGAILAESGPAVA